MPKDSKAPLFRPESLHAQRMAWLGKPYLPRSPLAAVVAVAATVIVIGGALFMTFGEYTRRVRVDGVVLPTEGLTRVASPASGWVMSSAVKEGAQVRKGDVLYTVSIDSTTSLGNTQDAVNELLGRRRAEILAEIERRRQIDIDRKRSLQGRIADMEREKTQVETQVRLLTEFTATMREVSERNRGFVARGIGTTRDYEDRLLAYMAQRTQLESLKRESVQIDAKLSETRNELALFDLRAASTIGELHQQVIDIDQRISEGEAKRELRVTAPRDGRVTGIITQAGQTVTPGTPLLTILPAGQPLQAQLLAPSSAIGFVREGDRVLLRYAAFPYQKFGQFPGTVTLISRATLRQEEVDQLVSTGLQQDKSRSLYRITVTPEQTQVRAYGRDEPLQAGMQLEAHILAETRPLYQWVLDPLYSLKGSISTTAERR